MSLRLVFSAGATSRLESRSSVVTEKVADQRPLVKTWSLAGGGTVSTADFNVGWYLLLEQIERHVTVRVNVVGRVGSDRFHFGRLVERSDVSIE